MVPIAVLYGAWWSGLLPLAVVEVLVSPDWSTVPCPLGLGADGGWPLMNFSVTQTSGCVVDSCVFFCEV